MLLTQYIKTQIDIDAPPERVWAVLTKFSDWPTWNEFIPSAEGKLVVGGRVQITVVPPGRKPMVFRPKVYVLTKNKEILWGGSFLGFVYRGDHRFLLEALPGNKTRFRQVERFQGPLTLFMKKMIRDTEVGYHEMNQALKQYVTKDTLR